MFKLFIYHKVHKDNTYKSNIYSEIVEIVLIKKGARNPEILLSR